MLKLWHNNGVKNCMDKKYYEIRYTIRLKIAADPAITDPDDYVDFLITSEAPSVEILEEDIRQENTMEVRLP